jgi:plasmid replication initiation protein
MKKIAFFMLFALVSTLTFAQKSHKVVTETKNMKVTYGQPSKKDREIFGKLVPYGQVWRTGANDATEITFTKDAVFGGTKVKAGTYSLFTIPGEKEWSVILNSELKQWGSYGYDKIKAKNVAEVKVASKSLDAVVEKLTISAEEAAVSIAWDKTSVSIPVKF